MSENLNAYDVFSTRMEEKFPKIFEKPYGGFAVGEGWWPILEKLCANIQSHIDWKTKQGHVIPQVVVEQIKEKFGGLRFYYEGGDEYIDGLVSMAESWANAVCEDCGKPATKQTTGWIKNVCDEHFEKIETAKKKRFGVEE
jgi:hypothetical protein